MHGFLGARYERLTIYGQLLDRVNIVHKCITVISCTGWMGSYVPVGKVRTCVPFPTRYMIPIHQVHDATVRNLGLGWALPCIPTPNSFSRIIRDVCRGGRAEPVASPTPSLILRLHEVGLGIHISVGLSNPTVNSLLNYFMMGWDHIG